jgi:NADPH:quinone reductase-like Zn-dependent oxidoreductase
MSPNPDANSRGQLVLVHVRASVPDRTGRRPSRFGFAGVVEGVGPHVREFRCGDLVYGVGTHAFADYVCVEEQDLAQMIAPFDFDSGARAALER